MELRQLPAIVEGDEDGYVVLYPELNTAGQRKSVEEASRRGLLCLVGAERSNGWSSGRSGESSGFLPLFPQFMILIICTAFARW